MGSFLNIVTSWGANLSLVHQSGSFFFRALKNIFFGRVPFYYYFFFLCFACFLCFSVCCDRFFFGRHALFTTFPGIKNQKRKDNTNRRSFIALSLLCGRKKRKNFWEKTRRCPCFVLYFFFFIIQFFVWVGDYYKRKKKRKKEKKKKKCFRSEDEMVALKSI